MTIYGIQVNSDDPITPRAIHFIDDKEIHVLGDWVSVYWNTKQHVEHKRLEHEGIVYQAEVKTTKRIPHQKPMIDFPNLRQDRETGEWYEDDGGNLLSDVLTTEWAQEVALELLLAMAYIEQQTKGEAT